MKARIGYARVRRKAQELLAGQLAAPVNLEAIANQLGAEIREFELGSDVSGILFRRQGRKVIVVNQDHPAVRKRFTIAHELGHLALHQGVEVHVDEGFRVNLRDSKSATAEDVEEVEANAFAANLLMPASWLRNDLKSASFDLENEDQIGSLAERYQVSVQAMTVRLSSLFSSK